MAITSSRYVYLGAHVTERTKQALRDEAAKRDCSMSLLVSLAIVEWLERSGHDLKEEPVCAVSSDIVR